MTLENRPPPSRANASKRELAMGLIAVVLTFASGVLGAATNASAGSDPRVASAPCTSSSVSETATTNATDYGPGRVVTMTASIHNTSTQTCTMAVGPTSPSLVVDNAGGAKVWSNCGSGAFHACALYLMLEVLQPGGSYTKTATWDQGTGSSGTRVATGSYQLTVRFEGITGQASTRFNLTALSSPRTVYVTAADSGRTYSLARGTRLVVALSGPTMYVWTEPVSSNPAVLKRTIGSTSSATAATFIAEKKGRARVTATGNPKCYPQCLMPSRLFTIIASVVD